MSFETLLVEVSEGIATVTANRPEKLNILSRKVIQELNQAFLQLRDNPEAKVVLITGAGDKAFIAGADIRELAERDAISGAEESWRGQSLLELIENLGKPVIAAINGFCLGGGCELALACTLRVASDRAKLGQPEVKIGIIPGFGGTQRLTRLVGKGRAMELCLVGDPIDAAQAEKIGLVNRVVPHERLMEECRQMARKMMANAPLAVRYAMRAVHEGANMPLKEALAFEASLFGLCCATEDKKEGMKAFLEKRAPKYRGV